VSRALTEAPVSIRAILIAIVALAAIPALAFSGLVLYRYAETTRTQAEAELEDSAKGVARAIDAEFAAAQAMLFALASSTRLAGGDLEGFGRQLAGAYERTSRRVVLVDSEGRVRASSLPQSYGDSAPTAADPAGTAGRMEVTDVISKGTGDATAYIIVPASTVLGEGWTLQAIQPSPELVRILDRPGVPRDWIVSIVDRKGVHLVRSQGNERFAGKALVPELVAYMRERRTGTLRTVSLEGIPLISTVAFAPQSGWAAAVGLPYASLIGPLRQQVFSMLALGAIVIAAALAAALLVARRLDSTMGNLALLARRVGDGEVVEYQPSRLREVDALGNVLAGTSVELQRRSQGLIDLNETLEDQVVARTAQLSDANAKLREEMALRERSEEQMRQMQKMEAVGQLTGGIAHDFNNMMAVVISSLRLMQRRLERGDTKVQEYIDGALRGAERAANLTRRLLAFSRQQPLSPETVDANKLIAGMEDVLRRTIPASISIETVFAGGLWRTRADAQGLESALINLAVNARDAMPDGGKLTIETSNAFLDEAYAASHGEVAVGQYVLLAVTDTGSGMPSEVVGRAFDPFFTTKPTGEGTGLGLSQVYGFIKQSGGHVKIYSEVGVGTTVKLYLPRLASSKGEEADVSPAGAPIHRDGQGQVVLVVEDDTDVRRLTVEMLEELNYVALSADGGARALAIMETNQHVALLLTDIVMPDINGRVLAEEAIKRRPDLKVLFTTGYTRNAIVHNGVLDQGVHLIVKPFTIEALAAKLTEILGPGVPPPGA
jgi:signal transduction histidine kinase